MYTTKRFNLGVILLLTSMVLFSSNLFAQQRQGDQQREGQGAPPIPSETQIIKMVDDLSAELSLKEDQKVEILALYNDHFNEVKSSMNSGKRPSREEMESLKEEFEDQVKVILNEDQQDLFDEFVKKNQKQNNQRQRR